MIKDLKELSKYIFTYFSFDCWLLLFLATYSSYCTRIHFYTPYFYDFFLFPITLVILGIYFYKDRKFRLVKDKKQIYEKKLVLVLAIIVVFLIGYLYITFDNSNHLVFKYTHDEIIVSEYAMENLLEGKNPYFENYYNTPLEDWFPNRQIPVLEFRSKRVFNPAFVTYAYLPTQFLTPLPFYLIIKNLFNWYDHRIFYFFCLVGIILILFRLIKNPKYRLLLFITLFFGIYFIKYSYYGWNVLLVLFFLLLCLYFLKNSKIWWSVLFLGLAVTSKQTALIITPFYFLYLYQDNKLYFKKILKKVILPGLVLTGICLLIVLPFFFWNKGAFIEDVLEYQTGESAYSYPINGLGFSRLVYIVRAVNSVNDYYPFSTWQIIFAIPLAIFLLVKQFKNNTLKRLILNYCLILFILWFFSRSFLDTHMTYIASFLPIAYFIDE